MVTKGLGRVLKGNKLLASASFWVAAATVVVYGILHVLLLAGLVTFGQRAGGYPLQALAVAAYGLAAIASLAAAAWLSSRARVPSGRLLPLGFASAPPGEVPRWRDLLHRVVSRPWDACLALCHTAGHRETVG